MSRVVHQVKCLLIISCKYSFANYVLCKALTRITADLHTEVCLQEQGMSLESRPLAGQRVILRENANLSTGGSANDVTAQ